MPPNPPWHRAAMLACRHHNCAPSRLSRWMITARFSTSFTGWNNLDAKAAGSACMNKEREEVQAERAIILGEDGPLQRARSRWRLSATKFMGNRSTNEQFAMALGPQPLRWCPRFLKAKFSFSDFSLARARTRTPYLLFL